MADNSGVSGNGKYPIIFLDRDGTINEDTGYVSDPDSLVLIPGAGEALALLSRCGYRLVVVTNQSGVARGYYSLDDAQAVNAGLERLLEPYGVELDGIFTCPHHPSGTVGGIHSVECGCRKPRTGLIHRAISELSLEPDWPNCWVIGDKPSDACMAVELGCRGILVLTGHGGEYDPSGLPDGVMVCADITEAAKVITGETAG